MTPAERSESETLWVCLLTTYYLLLTTTNRFGERRSPGVHWRRRRASPPIPAGSSQTRADTFRSALEQAEQQFRAAASVDYDSRALNLYYGLSQAGRAVAAAARGLGQDEWSLHAHGLEWPHLAEAGVNVSTLTVKPDGKARARFTCLSEVLGSPLPELVTLGELWPLMYETTLHAPLGATLYGPLPVSLGERMSVGAHGADNAGISLPPTIIAVPVEERPQLADFLARYPALQDWRRRPPSGPEIGWPERDSPLWLQWELTECKGTVRLMGLGVTGAVLPRMWLRGGLGQAVVDRPATWFHVVNGLQQLHLLRQRQVRRVTGGVGQQ